MKVLLHFENIVTIQSQSFLFVLFDSACISEPFLRENMRTVIAIKWTIGGKMYLHIHTINLFITYTC